MEGFRYKAFVSYSWADATWGKWLHHAIETYRTPAALVGKETAKGTVPARLHPLFKDREEEAAGASIGSAVETALANSEFLIVICSPNSARSEWVNREVAWFKTHRDPGKVLALIVDGEPGSETAECFPRALTHEVADDLTVTDRFADMPLAADARDAGDGKRRARLKLAAAMLGVGLDELVNRDERRRLVRTRIIAGASLALALVMSGLTWAAVQARNEAERQRAEADGLIEFMLTDLREKLEPVGRLDALDVVGRKALDYYARQKLGSLDADSLGRRSRALHLVGEVSNIRGNSEAGLKAFRQAAQTTGELLARAPNDEQRIFDHAQSVFWVGYIAYERGESKEAENQFREYKRLADRLVELNPTKKEWQIERSYAETNLGVMYDSQRRYPEAEAAFTEGLKALDAVASREKWTADRQIEVGTTANWLGKAEGRLGKTGAALAHHRREIVIYEGVLKRDPSNASAKNRLSVALQFLGMNLMNAGDISAAIDSYDKSLAINGALRGLEPDNTEWQETEISGLYDQAQNMIYVGRLDDARSILDRANRQRAAVVSKDPTNKTWSVHFAFRSMLIGIRLAMSEGRTLEALQLEQSTRAWLKHRLQEVDPAQLAPFYLLCGDTLSHVGRNKSAREMWSLAMAKVLPHDSERYRYALLKRLGRSSEATKLAAELDRRGYRHPAYLSERD